MGKEKERSKKKLVKFAFMSGQNSYSPLYYITLRSVEASHGLSAEAREFTSTF
jgi:hypothetical protein